MKIRRFAAYMGNEMRAAMIHLRKGKKVSFLPWLVLLLVVATGLRPLSTPVHADSLDGQTLIKRSNIGGTGPPQIVQEAREQQRTFCDDFANNKIKNPPHTVREVRVRTLLPNVTATIFAYESNDIVSGTLHGPGWEMNIVQQEANAMSRFVARNRTSLSVPRTFVDIGANIGGHTFQMAVLGFNVIAIEPMESNQYLIRRTLCHPANADWADRVTLLAVGLSESTKTCIVYSTSLNVGNGVTTCPTNLSSFEPPEGYVIRGTAKFYALDDLISKEDFVVPVVKMDVEGHEESVVAGGSKFFFKEPRIPFISTEVQIGGPEGQVFLIDSIPAMVGGLRDHVGYFKKFLDEGYLPRPYARDLLRTRNEAITFAESLKEGQIIHVVFETQRS